MSDLPTPELKAVRKCASHLEAALMVPNRDLVHFLRDQGFVSDEVHDKVLTPHIMWSEVEKSGELVKWITNRIKMDCTSFHILLHRLKQSGVLFEPTVTKLIAEYHTAGGETVLHATGAGKDCLQHLPSTSQPIPPDDYFQQEDSCELS
jgi:hypothetical protein